MACERLRATKILPPAVTPIKRLVAMARQDAQTETFRLVQPQLPKERQTLLDSLLVPDADLGMNPQYLRLAGEMLVDRARRDPAPFRDRRHRRTGKAMFGE